MDPACDCRRVVFNVSGQVQNRVVATINHAFEPPASDSHVPAQAFLDPLNRQSPYSDALLALFLGRMLDAEYAARSVRHYLLVKDAIEDPGHRIHKRIAEIKPPQPRGWNRDQRNRKKRRR